VIDQTARTEIADITPKVTLGREFRQDLRFINTPNTQDREAHDAIIEEALDDRDIDR